MEARFLNKQEEKLWDEFVLSHPLASIHQTSTWGHFQSSIPERGKYFIVVLEKNGKIIGGSMIIKHKLRGNLCWFYSCRGPLLNYNAANISEQVETLLSEIKKIAQNEKAVFFRIDPPIKKIPDLKGFKETKYGFQPTHTLILDLTKPLEVLLKEMKPKGRYNIHIAEKKGVKIIKADIKDKTTFEKQLTAFHEILLQTTNRDGFSAHGKAFYKDMLTTLSDEEKACLYLAKYENKIIAGILVTFFKCTAIYYYGASGNEHRNLMAPYLLQWAAIKEAKERGLKFYDFLGIAPQDAKNHPWKGVTEYKLKFGGEVHEYSKAKDYVFKKFHYLLYLLYKKLR
ncbi:MAG: peptidoglycan bridge formation glycyltransferase FemA/FemB family protein [Candidatus Gracilibacteria bacterium]|jgi:lipid II:glycine glycyltransferase (peptidoglycan interpeptide bridge formation enzyme)